MFECLRVLTRTTVFLLLAAIYGCVSSATGPPLQQQAGPVPIFPPQSTMRDGNYESFRSENEAALQSCKEPEKCALALFNLSFLYCYSKSPYYNPSKGLLFLEDLIKGAPESPWAYHARVWIDLLKKGTRTESRRRSAPREDARSKEPTAGETARQSEQQANRRSENARDGTPEEWSDRQRLEEEIRLRDETIKELNRQIQRAHEIDIEIEKKERGLLY